MSDVKRFVAAGAHPAEGVATINPLLTPTWNRLAANGQLVELPAIPPASPWSVAMDWPHGEDGLRMNACQSFKAVWDAKEAEAREATANRLTVRSTDDVDETPAREAAAAASDVLDVPAKNAVPRNAVDPALSHEAAAWLARNATQRMTLEIPAYRQLAKPVVVRITAANGCAAIAALDVLAREGSQVFVVVEADSPIQGTGLVGLALRIVAEPGARVEVKEQQTLDTSWTYLESFEVKQANSSRVNIQQTYLGGAESYIAFGDAMLGDRSRLTIKTDYLASGASTLDFNYLIRQFGRQTESNLLANGVLANQASKLLRGTIDLARGCKGSKGHEMESVLLADQGVKNRTIPIILCDEDDVQGDHGATIGNVPPSQRFYLQQRGLSDEAIVALFLQSSFDYAVDHAYDDTSVAAVRRLESEILQ